ncbi:DNA/RNA non-specific endonuclease [Phormidium sp. FACHB-592]|nr:DNA/RNA non-specific endonuclease [Phormidium sp. FACHB-592]
MGYEVQRRGAIAARIRSRWYLAAVGCLLLLLVGCNLLLKPPATISVHLALGNPSNATASPLSPDNYLMVKPEYTLSYNNSKRIPNWVSWQLNESWLGTVRRSNDFRPDDQLPAEWYRVLPTDYNGSGFDRGHLAPSGDRTNTPDANSATFLMTNILPQSKANNQGPWQQLESDCRSLVRQGKELYIVAGGYGKKRVLTKGSIVVPAYTWKVIVVLDRLNAGSRAINEQTRVIAVSVPNFEGIRETDWQTYRVSVDAIEAATGYDFLTNVPVGVQAVLERRVDTQ